MAKQGHARGFTLIELMIVVAIVAILAAIAYPAYSDYIRKGRRADGKAALMALQQAQEKFRAICPQYATGIGTPTADNVATAANEYCNALTVAGSATSAEGYYTISITAADATGYTLQAAATTKNGQNNDSGCTTLTLNQAGTKTPASCW